MARAERRGWQRWQIFVVVALGVALVGGVSGLIAGGGTPAPTSTTTPVTE